MNWGAIFSFAGKAIDYGTKAAALYSTVDALFTSADPLSAASSAVSPISPTAPTADPAAVSKMNAAADKEADEEKKRRRLAYENKNQTVMNTGGLGGLATDVPVGRKRTLLGGA